MANLNKAGPASNTPGVWSNENQTKYTMSACAAIVRSLRSKRVLVFLGHVAGELTAARNFNLFVLQIALHTPSAVNQDVVFADHVFIQLAVHIDLARFDVARYLAGFANLQVIGRQLT